MALTGVLAAAALVALPARTEAVTLNFECITNNGSTCETIETAFQVDVTQEGSLVSFLFKNNGLAGFDTGSITDIYFDDEDNNYLDEMFINDSLPGSGDVDFSEGASPGDLPGGGSSFNANESADSDSPVSQNGIGVSEFLKISFNFNPGGSFQNVLNALTSGAMRIGLHVQSIDIGSRDFSESFVSNPYTPTNPTPVPEPASLILFGSGLAGLAGMARKRRALRAAQQ